MRVVAGYEIVGCLHRGLRSLIYRARRLSDAASVVLKLPAAEFPDAGQRAAVLGEYRVLNLLQGQGAIRALGLERAGNVPVLVLEDRKARSLSPDTLAPMARGTAGLLAVGAAVARALARVHGAGVYHGDVAAANILCPPQPDTAVFIDFAAAFGPALEGSPCPVSGRPSHWAPEWAGQAQRPPSPGADLYALGVTLYELFTGRLPFERADPLEAIHAHIAQTPPPLRELRPMLPAALEAIVMKCLAKSPEARYQSAAGLAADLEECLRRLRAQADMEPFPLGLREAADGEAASAFVGRRRERRILDEAFARVRAGGSETVLVAGYSGIGKTSLVERLKGPAWDCRAFFLDGKFEALRREIPYTALAKALGKAVRLLLGETPQRLAALRLDLATALGEDARLLVEVVPELRWLIDPKTAVPLGSHAEAKLRLARLYGAVLRTLAGSDRAVILFLDDLQWADADSLDLLAALIGAGDVPRCLIVASYRDNEIAANPQAVAFLDALAQGASPVSRVRVDPLTPGETAEFLSLALRLPCEMLGEAAAIVSDKTGGNPYFVGQLLRDKAIRQAVAACSRTGPGGRGHDALKAAAAADNIAEATARALWRLPADALEALSLAACLGNRFDGLELGGWLGVARERLPQMWQPCLEAGMLLRDRDGPEASGDASWGLRFAHDKIQEAALARLSPAERAAAHERLGRLLLQAFPPQEHPARLFDIADQFLLAKDRFTAPHDRAVFGRITCLAAERAIDAAAFPAAWTLAAAGMEVLGAAGWDLRPDLAATLWKLGARASLLAGLFPEFEAVCRQGLAVAQTPLDQAYFLTLRARLHLVRGENRASVEDAKRALARLGKLPGPEELEARTGKIIGQIMQRVQETPLDGLLDLPLCAEASAIAEMGVTDAAILAFLEIDFGMYVYLIATTTWVQFSQGLYPPALPAIACFGLLLLYQRRDYAMAAQFTEFSLQLCRKHLHYDAFLATIEIACRSVMPHVKSLNQLYPLVEEATAMAEASGSFYWSSIHFSTKIHIDFVVGKGLGEVLDDVRQMLAYSAAFKNAFARRIALALYFGLAELRGDKYGNEDLLPDDREGRLLTELVANKFGEVISLYKTKKIVTCYYLRRFKAAWRLSRYRKSSPLSDMACLSVLEQRFYAAMSLLALCEAADRPLSEEQAAYLQESLAMFRQFSESCPENFASRLALLEAQWARATGMEPREVTARYEQAIDVARRDGFGQIEALAHELSGRFLLAQGREEEAGRELAKAQAGYRAWGATRVMERLAREFRDLLGRGAEGRQAAPSESGLLTADRLDYLAILKAARAISGETDPSRLVPLLMGVLLEAAGAERGAYFRLEADGPRAVVVSDARDPRRFVAVEPGQPGRSLAREAALGVVRYVARTGETVVVADAASDAAFGADARDRAFQPRSVLCLAVPGRAGPLGLVYLENNQMAGAFTAAHRDTVLTLAAQAAISLENAFLFETLRTAEEKYRGIVDNAPLGIFQCAPDGRLLGANPALAAMAGFPGAAAMLRHQPNLTAYDADGAGEGRWLEMLAACGDNRPLDWAWRRRDGARIRVRLRLRPIPDADGGLLRLEGLAEDVTEALKRQEEIRLLNREMLRIQDLERARVAMDLHDDVAQTLLAARLDLARLLSRPAIGADGGLRGELERLQHSVSLSLASVRDLSHVLRPPDIDRMGLAGALEQLCEETAQRSGVAIAFRAVGAEPSWLKYEIRIHCFRLLQEALNNAVRHAGAARIAVRLALSPTRLAALVKDDGQGFDVAATLSQAFAVKRMGLRGMQERAAILGGRLRIRSCPGQGTCLTLVAQVREDGADGPRTEAGPGLLHLSP